MITHINFTEGKRYEIAGGYFQLLGITANTLLFSSTRDDGSKLPIEKLQTELQALIDRLSIEEQCASGGGKCGKQGCGNCHPENFISASSIS